MAKSLSSIMSQIERLQKEAAAIQSEVVMRIRKDIAKFGLTPEQLFGTKVPAKAAKPKTAASKSPKPPKYADGAGNTWAGMGKRPDWLRQALAAGQALEDFLIGKASAPAPTPAPSKSAKSTKADKPKRAAAPEPKAKAPAKKRVPVKSTAARKPRAKAAAAQSLT